MHRLEQEDADTLDPARPQLGFNHHHGGRTFWHAERRRTAAPSWNNRIMERASLAVDPPWSSQQGVATALTASRRAAFGNLGETVAVDRRRRDPDQPRQRRRDIDRLDRLAAIAPSD